MKILLILIKYFLKLNYFFIKLFTKQKNEILFLSRQSNDITLNYKLLIEELEKQSNNIKINVICEKVDEDINGIVRNEKQSNFFVTFFSKIKVAFKYYLSLLKQMKLIARSKVVIIDGYNLPISLLKHKKGTTIIQMWHALAAFKQFGYQTLDRPNGIDSKVAKILKMHENYDYVISGSKYMAKPFSEAFNVSFNKVLNIGTPQIDYLSRKDPKLEKKIYNKYPQMKSKINILYAPTFRNDNNYEVDNLFNKINYSKYNLIMVKHPKMKLEIDNKNVVLIDRNEFRSFDILKISDYVITDYSAFAVDALICDKKLLFYLYDFERYKNNNGLNFDYFKEYPKYSFKEADDLVDSLEKKYDMLEYKKLKKKLLPEENFSSTEKIVELVMENLNINENNSSNSIKIFFSDLVKKSVLFRKLARVAYVYLNRIRYLKYYLFNKVDDKLIFFEAFGGRNYTCSPKAIYEKMLIMDEFKDYKFVWAFQEPNNHDISKDDRTTIVKSGSRKYLKYLASSEYWIVNFMLPLEIVKKRKQIYVQCWHGTPLKKLRYDIEVEGGALNTASEIRKRNDKDSKRYDYFLSPTKYASEKFRSAFNLEKLHEKDIIIEEGYPRNDFLFNKTKKEINAIKQKLEIPLDKKVIFYMPTFRDNQHKSGIGYIYKLNIDFDSLKKKFEKNYFILFSTHYFIGNKINLDKYEGFIKNVSGYDEINELFLVSDILITDYSSVMFDFANLRRPMILYMYDYDDYKEKLRDFYISLEELPGKIVYTQKDLEKAIEKIYSDSMKNKKKYEAFNKKYNYLDDGDASIRVINKIFLEDEQWQKK